MEESQNIPEAENLQPTPYRYSISKTRWKRSEIISLSAVLISLLSVIIAALSLRNTNQSIERTKKADSSNLKRFESLTRLHEKENQSFLQMDNVSFDLNHEVPYFRFRIQNIGIYPAEITSVTTGLIFAKSLQTAKPFLAVWDSSHFYLVRGLPIDRQYVPSPDSSITIWKKGLTKGFLTMEISYIDMVTLSKRICHQTVEVYANNPTIYNVVFLKNEDN